MDVTTLKVEVVDSTVFQKAPPWDLPRVVSPKRVGQLEGLPKWLNLVPIVAQWLWLSLRYGSITLPSCANPEITSGGMVGEGKMEYLASMGPHALSATARTASVLHEGEHTWSRIELAMCVQELDFPVVVKPDLGWCGYGVRLIADRQSLQNYVRQFPQGESLVLQEFLAAEGEAGLFYMREPGQTRGRLIGMLLRHYPRVTGDGILSVSRLMALDSRLARIGRDGQSEPCCNIDRVPAAGEVVRLSTVSSTRVGGLYVDGTSLITPALTQAVDAIARDMKHFHAGRFDVKFDDLKALQAGLGFKVIEVNGAGSEAVHAWDPAFTLKQAYAIIFDKQRRLFSLAAAMRKQGHRPIGLVALARLHFRQQALIARYPPSN